MYEEAFYHLLNALHARHGGTALCIAGGCGMNSVAADVRVLAGAVVGRVAHRGDFGEALFFTASTSFANPAVTLARSLTPTFAGIRLGDVLPFVGAQGIGLVVGLFAYAALSPSEARNRA